MPLRTAQILCQALLVGSIGEWGIILVPPYIAHRILNRSELQCIYCMMCLVAFTERRVEEVCVCDGGIEPHKYPILASSNMFNLMESNW